MFQIKLKVRNLLTKLKHKRTGDTVSKQAGQQSLFLSVAGLLFKLFVIAFFGMLILFPFYYMLSGSLMSYDEIADKKAIHLWPKNPQWSNFTEAFEQGYWSAIILTAGITFFSIVLKIIVTMMMGYAFSMKEWRGKKAAWFFLLTIMMLPEVALMSGQFKMVTDLGWRQGSMLFAALSLPFIASVFSALMFRNAFAAIPDRTKEAAMVDGVAGWKYFFKIALPMVTPTTWTVGILTAFAAWNSYMWPALLLSNGGDQQVMSTWLFTTGKNPDPLDSRLLTQIRLAGAIVAILPMFIVYFAMRGRIMRAISRQGSAIKG